MAVNKLLKTASDGSPDDLFLKTDAAGAADNNLKLTHADAGGVISSLVAAGGLAGKSGLAGAGGGLVA